MDDVSPGAWIEATLGGEFGAVTLQVPRGYAAYARICHPAEDGDGRPVSWSEVARATGRTAHPLMQWHALVGSWDSLNFRDSLWDGRAPHRGDLAPRPLAALSALLAAYTDAPERCFFGVWEGWAWVHGGGFRMTWPSGEDPGPVTSENIPAAFTEAERARARLYLPGREYVLLSGPLAAVGEIGEPEGLRGFEPHSPNLCWPADHAWFLASEIDFDSTLVGGSAELIAAILDAPALEAWPVRPDDSLAYDADLVNEVPGVG